MAGLTYTVASQILKEDYKAPLREQINQSHFILTQIEKNTDDVVGLRAYIPVHVKRSTGVGSRGELGTLPTAGAQGYTRQVAPLRFHYGRIQVSGPIIKAMAKDRGAFVQAVKSETDGIKQDLMRDVNRQIWGTSNGVIATCGTTTTSNTVQLAATTTATELRQAYADGGMIVDIGTVASPTTIASARTVTAVDTTNKTITISGATVSTVNGTHFIFRSGNGGASDGSGNPGGADGQFELTGLRTIVFDSGTLYGINPSTYPVWKSQRYTNGGTNRNVAENLVNTAIQDTEIAGGGDIDLLVSSAGVSRAVAALMTSMRRNIDNVELKAGYSGIRWSIAGEGGANKPPTALVWDRDCPENRLFGLDSDDLVEYIGSDWDWMDDDGAVLSRVSGVDAYEATFYKYNEVGCYQRNSFFVIEDLAAA